MPTGKTKKKNTKSEGVGGRNPFLQPFGTPDPPRAPARALRDDDTPRVLIESSPFSHNVAGTAREPQGGLDAECSTAWITHNNKVGDLAHRHTRRKQEAPPPSTPSFSDSRYPPLPHIIIYPSSPSVLTPRRIGQRSIQTRFNQSLRRAHEMPSAREKRRSGGSESSSVRGKRLRSAFFFLPSSFQTFFSKK